MKIEVIKIDSGLKKGFFQADCKDCPGSPPVGYGKTKVEAMAALFYLLMFDRPGPAYPGPMPHRFENSWLPYIKVGEPIVINGKMWKNPCKTKR